MSYDIGPPSPVPDLTGKSRERIVTAMVEWFFGDFEDPAENMPYESAEGGYQWIWGGPYNANEELQQAFLSGIALSDPRFERLEGIIKEAAEKIEEDGWEWAPHSCRMGGRARGR